jgi:tetratricopeptide (TPR) repeat protein
MKRLSIALAFVALSGGSLAAREWSDTTGQIKVEAEYVGQKDGAVILRKPDGELAKVQISKLSPADQQYVKTLPAVVVGGRVEQPAAAEKPAATDRFSQAIEANPNDPTAYYTRGMARLNRGEHGEAMADFNKAIELKKDFAAAYDGLGVALSKSGKPMQAHANFDKAIELDPEMASAYRHRGDNVEALWNSPEGKEMLKQRSEIYREKYEKARASNLTKTPWQPLNTTSGNTTPTLGQMRQVDYLMAREIEDRYGGGVGGGGGGIAYGGGGVSVGYGGVKVVNGGLTVVNPGTTVVGNPPLSVYPEEVVQGQTVTLVANPSQLEMPVQLGPNGKPIRARNGAPREPVYAVDFYRDVDGDGLINPDADEYLATDPNGKDGFSVEVSTAAFTPGNQAYFAVGRGKQPTGVPSTYGQAAEAVKNAIETERGIAEKSKSASENGGYTTEDAQKLLADQDRIGQTTQKMASAFAQTSPEAATALNNAAKAMLAARTRLTSATKYPGEKSVPIATAAASKAEEAANLLDQAYASLAAKAQGEEEGKPSPSPAAPAGGAAVASGMVKPGQGGPPANAYAGNDGPGNDGPARGSDDNNVVRDDDDRDVVVVDDDDDDRVVVRDTIDRALGYIEEDDYDRAVVEYDRYLVDDPDNDDVLLHRADALVTRGSYDYAVRDYDQLVTLGVETAELYYNRGCAHLAAGRIREAITDFDKSISLDETRNLAYTNRGSAYARLGDFETAIANFNAAIELDPRDSLAYRNRALAYKKLGKLDLYEQDVARAKEFSITISGE